MQRTFYYTIIYFFLLQAFSNGGTLAFKSFALVYYCGQFKKIATIKIRESFLIPQKVGSLAPIAAVMLWSKAEQHLSGKRAHRF